MACAISIVIALVGFICITALPVEQYPNIAPPTVRVSTSYTGADANTIMKSVVQPLEENINGVPGMTYITSTASASGEVEIQVYFKQGTDPDLITKECHAYTGEVLTKINNHLVKLHEISYGKGYFDIVRSEMQKINSLLQDGSITSQGAARYLELLKERLELREKNKWLSLIKAELVPNRVDEAEEISRNKYIIISGFLGLLLGLAYVTGHYCWRLFKMQ